MAFVFDAVATSATMNSYTSVSFADDYFVGSFKGTDWSTFDEAKKQGLLVQATNVLDTFVYGGLRNSRTQPLLWPRSAIYNDEGTPYPSNVVPIKVQQATCELAYWIYTESNRVLDDTTLQQLDKFVAGPVDFTIKKGALIVPREVQALLTSIGPGTLLSMGDTGGAKTMNMSL